jgi:hypothetical protein
VSTEIVGEAKELVCDIGIWGEESPDKREELVLAFEAVEGLRAGLYICRLLAPSCACEGRLAFTMFPSASLQSLFRVASIPSPSPPASSSFSLWRAMCRSLEYVRPRCEHCSRLTE